MNFHTKEISIIILCVALVSVIVAGITISLHTSVLTYEGSEGKCLLSLSSNMVTCYSVDNKEICSYKYNYKDDGHWCNK